jgi:hypothetical protein
LHAAWLVKARRVDGPLTGGHEHAGQVVRVGDTIRRPRGAGAEVVEALLVHLAAVGFDAAPRFLGVDGEGRQVLTFVPGEVHRQPPWQLDDEVNAVRLGELAGLLHRVHAATASFAPPGDAAPRRPLPLPGMTWTHGDPGYPNVVYRGTRPTALIDWEFAAPADALCDPAALLALSVRGPRPDAPDHERRESATRAAFEAIADGYGMDGSQRRRLPAAAAVVLDDTVTHWRASGSGGADADRLAWRAAWFRRRGAVLSRWA